MDFSFTEAQTAVAGLARRIFEERLGPAALKALEAEPERFDPKVWGELAQAGLLGMAIPEAHGGAGHGLLELCALLEEAGSAVAPLPLWETLVLGASTVERFGSDAQRARFLPRVATGECLLTAALAEPDGADPMRVTTTARMNGGAWKLHGVKTCVPAAALAERILVPAATGDEGMLGVFLVDPRAPGVKLERQIATTGDVQYRVSLEGVRVAGEDVLGDPSCGAQVLEWLLPRATVALCAMELGVAERALKTTATYTTGRQQFERPIATFQAVAQRAADAFIDVESIRVTTWQAAWRLSEGLPSEEAVRVAKFFAAEAGHRVVYAAQHLHGGMGFDVEYPLYRYYLRSKQIELTLGNASEQIAKLGRQLAAG
jgi:alkylation response protein AidB-like acyl-CoA dehydrogenase